MKAKLIIAIGFVGLASVPLLALTAKQSSGSVRTYLSAEKDILVPPTSQPAQVRTLSTSGPVAHTNHLVYVGASPARSPSVDGETIYALSGPSADVSLMALPSGFSPSAIQKAYGAPANGGSNAIAVVNAYDAPTALNDFNVFALQYKLPTETASNAVSPKHTNKVFEVVYANGKPPVDAGWAQESSLDMEWTHAIAPKAKIYLVLARSSSMADMMAAVSVAANLPNVREVSMSFGCSEWSGQTGYDKIFNNSKVVFFASSGDTAGERSYPSCSPNVVSVGGTALTFNSSGVVTSESAWSYGGGGPSRITKRPVYQNKLASTIGTYRGAPDISLVADPRTGCAVYDSTPYMGMSGWMVFGGTSLASPIAAGLANASGQFYLGSAAELNHIYNVIGTANFRDIKTGRNAYSATTGYDFATGVGAPVGTYAL